MSRRGRGPPPAGAQGGARGPTVLSLRCSPVEKPRLETPRMRVPSILLLVLALVLQVVGSEAACGSSGPPRRVRFWVGGNVNNRYIDEY